MNRRKSGLPVEKHLDAFDYQHQITINKCRVNQLLGFDVCKRVLFGTALALIESMAAAELKGALKKKITTLCKSDLVIIDKLATCR